MPAGWIDFVCLFCFNGDPNSILAVALWGCCRISSLYRMDSLKTGVKGLFPKEKHCFWCWKFWWHITEPQCCWNGSDAGLAVLCWWDHAWSLGCGCEPRSALGLSAWCAAGLGASSQFGSQQPLVLECAGSGRSCWGEPCEAFSARLLKLCTPCSAARSKGGGGWFLRGHTSQSGISAWLRSTMGEVWLPDTSMVSQLSLWPADGVERILLFGSEGNNFSSIFDLELEQHIFSCAFSPPSLAKLHQELSVLLFFVSFYVLWISVIIDCDQKTEKWLGGEDISGVSCCRPLRERKKAFKLGG